MDQAAKDSDHVRTVELKAIAIQGRDQFLHRVFPVGVVLAFLISSTVIAFANIAVGAISFAATMAGVITLYLKRSVPPRSPPK